jgi:hypothetical protein
MFLLANISISTELHSLLAVWSRGVLRKKNIAGFCRYLKNACIYSNNFLGFFLSFPLARSRRYATGGSTRSGIHRQAVFQVDALIKSTHFSFLHRKRARTFSLLRLVGR